MRPATPSGGATTPRWSSTSPDLGRAFPESSGGSRRDHPDAVVLSGRCYERESVPYKAFDGIADRLSRYMNGLDPVTATNRIAGPSFARMLRATS